MTRPTIIPLENGPYLVQGLDRLAGSTGEAEVAPKIALCRCGASERKPLCDGTHGRIGWTSEKSDDRTPDRREDYVGDELTIHDNRGACAHAGVCTERLPAVWRMHEEPWIDPNAGPAAEIAAVVRACPSGALGITLAGQLADSTDAEPGVLVAKDGPYVVTGGANLEGAELCEGVSDEMFTLCRCGVSKNKPFCDGSHWGAEFRDGSD